PPTQVMRRTPVGKPVFTEASPSNVGSSDWRNSPTPPRRTPRANDENCPRFENIMLLAAVRAVDVDSQLNPMRGLTCHVFGAWSVRAPNRRSISALCCGLDVNAFA